MTSDILTIQTMEDFRKLIKSSIDGTSVSDEAMQNSVSAFLEQTGLIEEAVFTLKDELQCAVCHEIPLRPCLTECHHIFCKDCLDMCLLIGKNKCPMCRKVLLEDELEPLLNKTEKIIDTVMLKHNPQYHLWKKQELLERFSNHQTEVLQKVYDKIVKYQENSNSSNYIGEIEELDHVAQKVKSLLEELPCSQVNVESFKEREMELVDFICGNPRLKLVLFSL